MKRIFTSRHLDDSSPIKKIADGHQLVAKSLLQFSPIAFEAPKADWIFFYSRNGVKYFFEQGNYALFPYLWACMSEGTADELSNYVTDISFVGTGNPEKITKAFKAETPSDPISCFIRAENSLDSINSQLNRPNDFSIPVYKNTPITEIPTQEFDILIFTSPMNVDAWLKKRTIISEKVIAIGNTTGNYLNSLHIKDVIVAKKPSEDSIAACLSEIV